MTLTVKDSFTGQQVWAKSDEGILKVSSVGAIGSLFSCTMQAAANTAAPSGDDEVKASSTGWKRVEFYARTAPSAGHAIIIGYSTTYNDANVPTNTHARVGGGVQGEVEYPNQCVITSGMMAAAIEWDGETSIKTFAIESTNTTAITVDVVLVSAE